VGRRARAALALGVALVATVTCRSFGGVRPRYGPVPGALLLEVRPSTDSVIRALAAIVREAGFGVRTVAPREGYLETGWLDLRTRVAREPGAGPLDPVVKLRFFADPVAGRTRLLAECVHRFRVDPSLPDRELERMVPDSHQGRAVLDSVLARIAPTQAGRDTTGAT
jgi:hypothetical protein